MDGNVLYYGDNLDVLRRHIKDESVDLVYLDPPFNSNASYNVLFSEHGAGSAAQIRAFEDTWRWDEASAYDYEHTVEQGGRVADVLRAFRTMLGTSDMLAYLSMMAPRLVELRRVMKSSASIYLHCDPTSSHYLKLVMDAVFDAANFRNEVVWKRSDAHNDAAQGLKRFGRIHDVLLFYSKSADFTFNAIYQPLAKETADKWYRHEDERGRFNLDNLTARKPGGDTLYEFQGVRPPTGRYWAYSRANMEAMWNRGEIVITPTGKAYRKKYLSDSKGTTLQDLWTDISMLRGFSATKERLGFPTQKPVALLDRIVEVSSNPGDVVLDPFCGCGTTIDAAQKLDRRWIGIDITHLAIGLIKHRLADSFGPTINGTYKVVGEPTDVDGARELAASDHFQFQAWALGLVGARVATSDKRGGDKGIDGRLFFHDEGAGGKSKQIIFSVKAGHLVPTFVRDLRGVLDREEAQIGVLLSFETPSAGMRAEAASAGFYDAPAPFSGTLSSAPTRWGSRHPRIQLLTVGELLEGKTVDYPHLTGGNVTHRRAPRELKVADQPDLGL